MNTIGVDVDVHAVYAIRHDRHVICNGARAEEALSALLASLVGPSRVLMEIASPVSLVRSAPSRAANYQIGKWMVFNPAFIARFDAACRDRHGVEILVAPSDRWTMGYDIRLRHTIAACTARNKDLRDAEAMIYFYGTNPERWCPLSVYLDSL